MDINSPTGRNAFVESRTGLTGLPPDWQTVLETSDISKEEVVQNGSAIVDVLRFHFNGVDNLFDSIPRASLSDHMGDGISAVFDSYAEIVLQDKDPALSYQGLNQRLGEGGYSAVYECAHANDG